MYSRSCQINTCYMTSYTRVIFLMPMLYDANYKNISLNALIKEPSSPRSSWKIATRTNWIFCTHGSLKTKFINKMAVRY